MSGKKIGLILALDGEREFTAAVQAAHKSTKLFETQLKGLAEEFEGNANSMDYLRQKQELLKQQQGAYQKQLEAAQAGQKKANENYREQCKRLEELDKQLESAKQAQKQMEESGQQGSKGYEEQTKAVAELEKAVEKQTIARTKEIGSISEWDKKVYEAERSLKKQNDEIERNEQYLKEAEQAADHCATSIDKMGREAEQASQEMENLGDTADDVTQVTTTLGDKVAAAFVDKGTSAALDLLKEGAEAVKESMYDLSGASAKLAASTGLSEAAAKKYQAVMKQIKGDNFGESYGDVADAMSEVIQIMGELDDSSMTEITESAITLRDTFDMDVNESIRAVDVMMKTMGVDATTAFDLITKGAQNGLNRSGELTDNLTEYAQIWGQAGFSAEEMFAILENGLDAGAYNLDKVNDYVKEFGNSLADGRIGDNIDYFSDGTKKLFEEWKNGKASTSDVFYSVINDLSEMENQQKALTIASEVWSSLGEDNAMQVITALDDVNDAYKNVRGTMDSLKEVRYSDLESAVSGLGSAIQENLVTPIADAALPKITGLFETATEVVNGIGEAITPQKTAVEELAESMQAANDGLETSIQNASATMENAELEATKIGVLGTQLLSLNGVEEKSLAQKQQLKEIVARLGTTIPEIAAAYDEEAGKVKLTDDNIRSLISSKRELLMVQALEASGQEMMNALVEAEVQLEQARMQKAGLEDKLSLIEEERQLYEDLIEKKAEMGEDGREEFRTAQLELWNNALKDGRMTLEEYNQALESAGYERWDQRALQLTRSQMDLGGALEEVTGNYEELSEKADSAQKEYDAFEKASDNVINGIRKETGELKSNADSSAHAAAEKDRLASENRNAAEAAEGSAEATDADTDALEANTEAAGANADAQKAAAQNIRDAYESARSEIESSLQNKISLTDMFDGGEDITTEQMNENLQSYLDGVENYQENLAKVKAMTDESGKALFSPEVIAEIEKGGLEYANMLSHMVYTWEEQGEYGYEQNKEIARRWAEALNITEGMAEVQAANRVAMEQLTGELGSTDAEFQTLSDAVDSAAASAAEGWAGLPKATETALQDTITTAQQCGIKIPEGLAEGIASGEVSPEEALEQLNGSIQGTFDGLAEMAENLGIDDKILSGLAEGIEAGGQEAVDAITQLVGLITGASPELQQAVEDAVKTDGVKTAVQESVEPGADAIGEAAPAYESKAKELGDAVAKGIEKGKEAVTAAVKEIVAAGAEEAGQHAEEYTQAGAALGEKISEGLQEAVSESDGTLILNPDGISEKSGEYETAGRTLGEAVVKGLQDTQRSINDALSPGTEGITGKSEEYSAAGTALGEAFAGGLENTGKNASGAGDTVAGGAAKAMLDKSREFQNAGQQSAQSYINALNAARQQAAQAGGAIASSARSAVASWENSFYNVGYNMASGVASGIYGGASGAVNAAVNMASRTLAAAKAALEIKSPSRKFQRDVGERISEGTAFGITRKASLAGKAAKKMSAKVYTNATSWLSKYKKSHKVSLDDEKWYWQQVQKHVKKGTDAYTKAAQKIKQISLQQTGVSSSLAGQIAKNFGVSKTTTTGSGKKKKTTKKDDATYYSEIYSAAERYLSNYETLHNVSLKQEKAYWAGVQKQLKKGTQGYYDAQKQINSINDQIAQAAKDRLTTQASVQDSILDKYKVYYKVSAKAEMDYWNTARKQFKTGTDERIEADRKYFEAMQEWYDQRKELDEDYLENSKDINDQLADSVKELQDAYKDAVAERKQDILSSMDLFEAWDADGYTMDTLLHNLQTQVAGLALWEQQLEKLKKRGISTDLYDYLLEQGPDAAANIYSLANATDAQLAEYEKLFKQKNALAQSQAVKDNESLRQETNKEITQLRTEAQAELNALNADYRAALQELNASMNSSLKNLLAKAGKVGEDAVSGLVGGIKSAADSVEVYKSTTKVVSKVSSGLSALKKESGEIGSSTLDGILAGMLDDAKIQTSAQKVIQSIKRAMEEEAEIHSPSRLFRRETGPQIPAGVALGMEDGTPAAVRSAQEMMQETLDAAQEEMEKRQTELQTSIPDYSGVMRLNRMLEDYQPQAPVVNVDNRELISLLGTLITVVNRLEEKVDSQQIVLDTGAIVGNIQQPLSQENAAVAGRRRRPR